MEKYVRKIELLQWNILVKLFTLLFFVGMFMIFGGAAIGQSYTTVTNGLASDASTWQGGNIPDFFGGPSGGDAAVQATDTIWHTGNIEIRGETFTINSGGALILYGDIKIKKSGDLKINGLLVCSGQLKTAGGKISGTGGEVFYGSVSGGTSIPGDVEQTTIEKTWVGSGSNDWNTAANWVPSGVPSVESIVISPVAVNMPVLTSFSTLSSVHILDEQGTFAIASGGSLTLTESLANEGVVILQSNSSGTGSLITSNATGNGTVHIQCYVPDNLPGDDWHMVSSPMASIELADFALNNEVNATTIDYDLAPYNEGEGMWDPYTLLNSSANFTVGMGYTMRRVLNPDNEYVIFEGVTSEMTSGNLGAVALDYDRNGWNALGNPYTSALNIETFLSVNGSSLFEDPYNVAYLWDPTISDYTGMSAGHVSVGQGFMVKSKTGGGNVNFTSAMQEHNSVVLKSGEIPCPTINLWATTGELQNRTAIKFNQNMTDGLDSQYDIGKFKGNPDMALYTRMPNNPAYDLQDQALPEIGFETKIVPIGLDLEAGAEVSFFIVTKSMPENIQIILEDTETGSYAPLNEEDTKYTTSVVAQNYGTGRFNLLIKKQAQTGIRIEDKNQFNIHTQNKIIYVDGPANADTQVELYSLDGRCWYKSKAQNQFFNQIDGSGFPVGVYLLRLNHLDRIQSSKFVLTEN